ncbi:MAG: flagellar hook-basal body protein [Desulfobacteraceae bacterium]|nr:flagellar hook-basal body protein [Desulfobacteraceae bacterium]
MLLEMTRPVQGGLRQQRKLDVVSNHLANADTAGFKRDILSFSETLHSIITTDLTQGPLKKTMNPLDLALKDEGFFKLETPQGPRYTRDGSFTLDSEGFIVNQSGFPVLMGGAPVQVDGDEIFVAENAMVSVDGEEIGQLDIVTFEDKLNLYKDGSNLYLYRGDEADEVVPQNISLEQGALELSNVSPVMEMTSMIQVSRTYETVEKMLRTFDEVDGLAVTSVGIVG